MSNKSTISQKSNGSDGLAAVGAATNSPDATQQGVAQDPKLSQERFQIPQNYSSFITTRKKAVVVPVGRPDKQQWVYFHPSREWRMAVMLLEDKANRRVYVVEPELAPEVAEDLVPKLLVAYVTRSGDPGLWAIRLPGEDGRIDTFNESALIIVNEQAGRWVRVLPSESQKSYSILECDVDPPAPKWPESFAWMFDTAFRGRIVSSLEHPLLQTLRGRTL